MLFFGKMIINLESMTLLKNKIKYTALMKTCILSFLLLSVFMPLNVFSQTSSGRSMVLHEHWYIQSSANLTDNGRVISLPGYVAKDWYPTAVPTTVLAALVANKVYQIVR